MTSTALLTGTLSPVSAFQQTAVSGDGVTGFEDYNIARYKAAALNDLELPAAQHLALGGGHALQRFYRGLSLALLNDAEHGVEQDDDKDYEHLSEALSG